MDERHSYSKDPRLPCRYGRKCYQKNQNHHTKYKHPPDPKRKNQYNDDHENAKRKKLTDNENDKKIHVFNEVNNSEISVDPDNESSRTKQEFTNGVLDSEPEDESKNNQITNYKNGTVHKPDKKAAFSNDVSDSESEEETKDSISSKNTKENHESITDDQHNRNSIKPYKTQDSTCNHTEGHNNDHSKKFIKSKFLLDMPEDFYSFFSLCERLNKENPCEALTSIGLKLIGPFDVLCGKFCGLEKKSDDYLIHWRYYFDPPNFQTVLKGDEKTGYHIGYFWDRPDENPVFLAENSGLLNGILTPLGGNIFGALSSYIEDKKKTCDPFSKMKFIKIQNTLKEEAEKLGYDISRKTKEMVKRNNKVLSKTFNQIGLVVPYERKTQLGYRKPAMTDKRLEALLTKINEAKPEEKPKFLGELQSEILTWTDIACDECDFGTGIELGWDILCHGVDLNHTTSRLLASNYRQLKWEAFAKIAEAHMANRRKNGNLSIL